MADPGFSPGGGANSQKCYYFSIFCQKLHENERIWTPRGGARVPGAPPWIRQCKQYFTVSVSTEVSTLVCFCSFSTLLRWDVLFTTYNVSAPILNIMLPGHVVRTFWSMLPMAYTLLLWNIYSFLQYCLDHKRTWFRPKLFSCASRNWVGNTCIHTLYISTRCLLRFYVGAPNSGSLLPRRSEQDDCGLCCCGNSDIRMHVRHAFKG